MIIIGCDYHPGVQQIAFVDSDTGEFQEARLQHREPAEQFYRELALPHFATWILIRERTTQSLIGPAAVLVLGFRPEVIRIALRQVRPISRPRSAGSKMALP